MKNPKLYAALERRFGKVIIANEDEPMSYTVITDPSDPAKKRVRVISGGEYYRVDCPYCNDTRARLWINYRWNTSEYSTDHGQTLFFGRYLAICYNEHCDLERLEDELKQYITRNQQLSRRVASSEALLGSAVRSFHPVELPGDCYPITLLSPEHPAVAYLSSRDFNIKFLFNMYGVYYCASSYPEYFQANPYKVTVPNELARQHAFAVERRIVFEIYKGGSRVGWQARYIGYPPRKSIPKYLTMPGFPRSQWLFGYDAAVAYPYVVVVEGVLDAIRVGPPAVALLGSSISVAQKRLLHSVWRSENIIIALDPDVQSDFSDYKRVNFPEGQDPGSLSFSENWDLIESQSGVKHVR
jgi:hypothetical protein